MRLMTLSRSFLLEAHVSLQAFCSSVQHAARQFLVTQSQVGVSPPEAWWKIFQFSVQVFLTWKISNCCLILLVLMRQTTNTAIPGPVLSKVEGPGSPNRPSMVDGWVAHITFRWPIYDMVRNDNLAPRFVICCSFPTTCSTTKTLDCYPMAFIFWQATRQQCCPATCHTPKQLSLFVHLKTQPGSFKTSWNLGITPSYSSYRPCFNVRQMWNGDKYFGNSYVAKLTTFCALWVAFGDQATIFGQKWNYVFIAHIVWPTSVHLWFASLFKI